MTRKRAASDPRTPATEEDAAIVADEVVLLAEDVSAMLTDLAAAERVNYQERLVEARAALEGVVKALRAEAEVNVGQPPS